MTRQTVNFASRQDGILTKHAASGQERPFDNSYRETPLQIQRRVTLAIILLATLAVAGGQACAAPPGVLCILVPNAMIASRTLTQEGKFGRANTGHQIVRGKRSVLAIRIDQERHGAPDAQLFQKATLEIDLPQTPRPGPLTLRVGRSYYSEGAAAWVSKGAYRWAANAIPGVTLRQHGQSWGLTLRADFAIVDALRSGMPSPGSAQLDVDCTVRDVNVDQLTFWMGRLGTNSQSFYGHD